MTRLRDVASSLGVSVSTVSRVLNNRDRVAPETRRKIEEAIRALDYEPNEVARRLKRNSSDVVGVIVPDISNPFFAEIVRGVQRTADEAGFMLLLCDSNSSIGLEKKSVSLLLRNKVAGIVSASVASGKDAQEIYDSFGNVIFIDNVPALNRDCSSVSINNYLAAKELVSLLLKKRGKNICAISGSQEESSAADRLRGCRDALAEAGAALPEARIRFGDYSFASGAAQMKELLKLKDRPSAVFAANNFMAYGAMQVIMQAGLSVPEDIAIATFDVFDHTGLLGNRFLYVEQPAFEIGDIASQLCIRQAQQKAAGSSCRMILPYTIRQPDSV